MPTDTDLHDIYRDLADEPSPSVEDAERSLIVEAHERGLALADAPYGEAA